MFVLNKLLRNIIIEIMLRNKNEKLRTNANLLSRFMLKQKCFLSFPIKALQSTPSAVRLGQIREIVGIHQGTKTILKLHRNFNAPAICSLSSMHQLFILGLGSSINEVSLYCFSYMGQKSS